MKQVLVIDAQGGGLGKLLVAAIKRELPALTVTAVGTNVAATTAMLRAGADFTATGENAVIVACRTADAIVGPLGIAIADALRGEVTPAMAVAVGQSAARRVLIPFNNCNTQVVGVAGGKLPALVEAAVDALRDLAPDSRAARPL